MKQTAPFSGCLISKINIDLPKFYSRLQY